MPTSLQACRIVVISVHFTDYCLVHVDLHVPSFEVKTVDVYCYLILVKVVIFLILCGPVSVPPYLLMSKVDHGPPCMSDRS